MRLVMPRREFAVLFAVLLTVAAGNTALQTVLPAIARVIHIPDMLVPCVLCPTLPSASHYNPVNTSQIPQTL